MVAPSAASSIDSPDFPKRRVHADHADQRLVCRLILSRALGNKRGITCAKLREKRNDFRLLFVLTRHVLSGGVDASEGARGLHHVVGPGVAPLDVSGVHLAEHLQLPVTKQVVGTS